MKIKLLQNYNNRELLAGCVVDNQLPESIKTQLVKDGKAELVQMPVKKVNDDKNKSKTS